MIFRSINLSNHCRSLEDTSGASANNKGYMKKGWWKIDYTIEPNDNDLEHIAEEIKKGYDQGEILQEENEKIHNRS